MKKWNLFGTNDLDMPVSVQMLEGPAWLIAANSAFHWSTSLYDFVGRISQPKFISNLVGKWDEDSNDSYTIDEYYGNLFQFWIYAYLERPLLTLYSWTEKQPKLKSYKIAMTLDDAISTFGENHSDIKWLKDHVDTQIKFANEQAEEKTYICPVCFDEMIFPPEGYNICCQCGTEFELDDEYSTYEELRAKWIAGGRKYWFCGGKVNNRQ